MRAQSLHIAVLAVGFICALALLFVGLTGAQQVDHSGQRAAAIAARADALADLGSDVHGYVAQLTAVLLFGKPQMDALGTARVEVERTLARLDQATRQQITTLGGLDQVASELPEVDATRRLIELYHAIDLTAARALVQQRDGKSADALQLFQADVQFRINNELDPLLDDALTAERAELVDERTALSAATTGLELVATTLAVLFALSLAVFALLLRRARAAEYAALAGGLQAVAAGEAVAPLPADGRSHLARLAAEFNAMAGAVSRRQAALAATGDRLSAEAGSRSRELEDANASLRQVDERRTQFFADVSHQLRTPLTILRGETDVALRGAAGPAELRQALERVQEQSVELGQLLDELIGYARADAEGRGHQPAEVRLDAIVGAAAAEGRALAEPREVAIVAALDGGACRVLADPGRLKQVLLIGLDNAIKHSPPGSAVEIEIAAVAGTARIRILDRGPGIDPAEQPRLFERFFRGRGEAELLNQGLGIGLAIARDIVERHGGTITIDNRDGGGAVLETRLPLIEDAAP